jgi:hypothetical protein
MIDIATPLTSPSLPSCGRRPHPQQLCAAAPGLVVRPDAGGGKGKGLFTTRVIREGDTILHERAIVSARRQVSARQPGGCCRADARGQSLTKLRVPAATLLQVCTQDLHSKMEVTTCAHCYTAVGERPLRTALSCAPVLTLTPDTLGRSHAHKHRHCRAGVWWQDLLPHQRAVRGNRGGRPAADSGQRGQGWCRCLCQGCI